MKRPLYIIILFCALSVKGYSQDYFLETLDKANRSTAYEAAYILSDYQQFLPTFPATYFHLGNIYYSLIETIHPIRDYRSLRETLYRARLYYGNCLHYAQGQNLKPNYYEGLPYSGKKPVYEDLERFIKVRMDSVASINQKSEHLFHSYYKLVNRYAYCRTLFTSFSEDYKRVKTAHLLLDSVHIERLYHLQQEADSLNNDIAQLQQALATYPIDGYKPTFRFEKIHLYRIDGLTNTNILQNDVVLWDYADWVREFLQAQSNTYATYYTDLDNEYQLLQQAIDSLREGHAFRCQYDLILVNRINRLDYQSYMADFIRLLQGTAQMWQKTRSGVLSKQDSINDDYAESALEILYNQYTELHKIEKTRINADQLSLQKYAGLLDKWGLNDVDSLARFADKMTDLSHQAYLTGSQAFAANIRPTAKPTDTYVNDLTNEKFGVGNLKFTLSDSVIAVLPIEEKFMVVTQDCTCYICSAQGELYGSHKHKTSSPVFAAYKYTSNTIALISDNEVLFVDTNGNTL